MYSKSECHLIEACCLIVFDVFVSYPSRKFCPGPSLFMLALYILTQFDIFGNKFASAGYIFLVNAKTCRVGLEQRPK
jgi:hypothetical protein